MMGFHKKDAVKRISYHVFVLGMSIGSKPTSTVLFIGTEAIEKRISAPALIEHSPMIAAMLTTLGLAFRIN